MLAGPQVARLCVHAQTKQCQKINLRPGQIGRITMTDKVGKSASDNEPHMPAGGWGSLQDVTTILLQEHIPIKGAALLKEQNKPDGFACVSCAWAKPAHPH